MILVLSMVRFFCHGRDSGGWFLIYSERSEGLIRLGSKPKIWAIALARSKGDCEDDPVRWNVPCGLFLKK